MERKLNIYFTSDVHGYLFPETYADKSIQPLGLLAAMQDFQKDGNTLILDGGDMLQGSALDLYCEKFLKDNAPQAAVVNAAGYDYVTIGNHDFNYGKDYLLGYLRQLSAKAVCANVQFDDPEAAALVQPYAIHTLANGLKIGIIGIVTDFVNVWEQKENLVGIHVTDPFSALRETLALLKDQVDLTVCIYHGGYEAELATGRILSTTGEDVGYRICQELPLDILLTGHQHMPFAGAYVGGTFTAQTPDKARQFLHLTAVEQPQGGFHVEASLQPVRMEAAEAAEQQAAKLSPCLLQAEVQTQAWLDQPLASLSKPLLPEEKILMAVHGSPIADLINFIQLAVSGAELACCGLANDVAGFRKEVTTRDVIASYPFPNTLVVLEISGAELKTVLERTAEYFQPDASAPYGIRVADSFLAPKIEHYNYDYFAGLQYVIDARLPKGQRVVSMQRNGRDILPEETFSLCLNNYRTSGAGGYKVYCGCKKLREINMEMTELLIDYFGQKKQVEVPPGGNYRVLY